MVISSSNPGSHHVVDGAGGRQKCCKLTSIVRSYMLYRIYDAGWAPRDDNLKVFYSAAFCMVMIIIILWKSSFDLVSSYKFSWGKSYTITSWYVCFVISSFPCILPLNIYRCLFVRVCFCFLILRASVLVHCSRVIVSLRPLVVVVA